MSSVGRSNRDNQMEDAKDQAPVASESALTISSDPKHTNFIMAHSNCPLCGSELELNHKIDSFGVGIKEEARCPHCQIRTRARNHTLQYHPHGAREASNSRRTSPEVRQNFVIICF